MAVLRVGLARTLARTFAILSMGLLATACTVVTGGKAHSPPNLAPQSVTGQAIRQVLLGDDTLSRIFQQRFIIDERLPPRFGGPEALRGLRSASPADCLGVAEMLHENVYPSSKVNDVAVENWRHAVMSANVTGVKEGVVSLPTPADANALFSRFAEQWQRCDGQALVLPDPVLRLKATDVYKRQAVEVGGVDDFAGPLRGGEAGVGHRPTRVGRGGWLRRDCGNHLCGDLHGLLDVAQHGL